MLRQDLAERQALSVQLISHLLSDESQKALTKALAFRAAPGEALYASRTGFAALERWLNAGAIQVPDAFDTNFRGAAKAAADELVR